MPRPHKYGVSAPDARTWLWKCYASKAEMEYAQRIARLQPCAFVREQPRIKLGPVKVYVPDFYIEGKDGGFFVDVKGVETPAFKEAKRFWREYGPGELHVVKKKGKNWHTTDVVPGADAAPSQA